MLNDNCGPGYGQIGASKECPPDYEAQIKGLKIQLTKVVSLKDAIFEYKGDYFCKGKVAEIVGSLVFEERHLESLINENIKAQEKSKYLNGYH